MKDYLGNELRVGDRVAFIWPNCAFQEGRIEYLYEEYDCITVNSGGNLYTTYPDQCVKVNL